MAVKTNEGLSSSFECVVGVKQGCPLSPILFGVYLDDHHEMLDFPEITVHRVPVLLYADDLALVATSARWLQSRWTYRMHTQTHHSLKRGNTQTSKQGTLRDASNSSEDIITFLDFFLPIRSSQASH